MGPTIAQLWAEYYLQLAGVRAKLLAEDGADAAATKSTIIAITDEDEVNKVLDVTDSKDLAWPEDLKIQGLAVSLCRQQDGGPSTGATTLHGSKRSRAGALRSADDQRLRSFNTHDAVEWVVDV